MVTAAQAIVGSSAVFVTLTIMSEGGRESLIYSANARIPAGNWEDNWPRSAKPSHRAGVRGRVRFLRLATPSPCSRNS
jgi:hypothetical protein